MFTLSIEVMTQFQLHSFVHNITLMHHPSWPKSSVNSLSLFKSAKLTVGLEVVRDMSMSLCGNQTVKHWLFVSSTSQFSSQYWYSPDTVKPCSREQVIVRKQNSGTDLTDVGILFYYSIYRRRRIVNAIWIQSGFSFDSCKNYPL